MGSCTELESGEYLLTINTGVGDVSISLAVDYCPWCGSKSGQPASFSAVGLDFVEASDEW
jgi:hypothetical protein